VLTAAYVVSARVLDGDAERVRDGCETCNRRKGATI
jgi:hypothetical protein